MHKIKTFWAFIGTDTDGAEGVPAFYDPHLDLAMPLVGSDRLRVESLRNVAQSVADQTGMSLELRQFTQYVVVDVIKPKGNPSRH